MTDLINAFAPWPETEDKVTADACARHLTVEAFRTVNVDIPRLLKEWRVAGKPDHGPVRDAFDNASLAASALYGLIYMLREAAGPNTVPADKLALGIHAPWAGDFDAVASDLSEWLSEYGIDAEQILRAAETEKADA
jgi:hypothetical protein